MKKNYIFCMAFCLIIQIPVLAKDTLQPQVNLNWWSRYNDPVLVDYINEGSLNNHDIKISSLNIEQANQAVKMSFSRELPTLVFSGAVQREFESSEIHRGTSIIPNYNQTNFVLPLTMSYELDIWGKNRLKTKSLNLQKEIIVQDQNSVSISLQAAIASDYFNLVRVNKKLKNLDELISIQEKIVTLTEIKKANGLIASDPVLIEKQTLSSLNSEKNLLIDQKETLSNELSVLLGKTNQENDFLYNEEQDCPKIPNELNANLIQYRPDYLRSEILLKKAGVDVKIAKKEFLPSFLISGQIGFNAYSLGRIFAPETWLSNIGIFPDIDLFTGGLKKARMKFNKIEFEKAGVNYEKTCLESINELNDSVSYYKTTSANLVNSIDSLDNQKEIEYHSRRKFEVGLKSSLDYLKAKQALLIAQNSNIDAKINNIISTISIFKSVGGVDVLDESI